jgi:hypothetical protein
MKKTKSQLGRMSRNKGARAEREVATKLSTDLGKQIKRKLGASREGGSDIEIDSNTYLDKGLVMHTHPGWSIEVKHHNTLSVAKWWEQTLAQSEIEERRPLLMFRSNRSNWTCMYYFDGEPVMTDYETWLELYKTNRI